jgi:putative membrane protein insertion efficiency factor
MNVVAGTFVRLGRVVARWSSRAATVALVGMVIAYQWTISPLLGRHCRFTPSCSNYFRAAVERHGPIRGSLKGLARIARCHPWSPGGYDPP